jgi:hypothetical protein
VVK